MKIVRRILLAVAIIIAIPLIVALFLTKDYTIVQEVNISKPRQVVFDYIKQIKNQDYYNKWVMADPKMKKDYTGTDGTVGFVYAWDSKDNHVGKGQQEIKNINEGERVDCEIRFIKPFEGIATTYMALETLPNNDTRVKWVFSGKMPYPTNLLTSLSEKMMTKDLAFSLTNLKKILENQ